MLAADGSVYAFGTARACGTAHAVPPVGLFAADIQTTPKGGGYWTLLGSGFVELHLCGLPYDFCSACVHGANLQPFVPAGETAVSLSATPDGSGLWVFTDRGRVVTAGTAKSYGDMSNVPLNGPILDSVATPSGKGYYMVASDGGIFAFGDAKFAGSMGGKRLNQPVQSMAPDPDGNGYWLVAADGGVFAFGAPFYGSMGSVHLNRPVVGIVASPTGHGYLMVALDGGIFAFGDVPFHGSLGNNPPFWPILSVTVMP
jgi:hypothetical protein